jgi:hypothetical protein
MVISTTVDYGHGTLTINGQNFGSSPTVRVPWDHKGPPDRQEAAVSELIRCRQRY